MRGKVSEAKERKGKGEVGRRRNVLRAAIVLCLLLLLGVTVWRSLLAEVE